MQQAKYNIDYYNSSFKNLFIVTIGYKDKVYYKEGIYSVMPKIKEPVYIGIDESTSQTGLCITNVKGEPILLVDIINKKSANRRYGKSLNKEDYINMLQKWVFLNFKNLNIIGMIYEEVGYNAKQKEAKKALTAVVEVFKSYIMVNDLDISLMPINNLTWKKHFLADERYKGRRKERSLVKAAVQEEVIRRYPNFEKYQDYNDGADSCDAMGVIQGYFAECFVNNDHTKLKVNHMMEQYPKRKYFKKYYDINKGTTGLNTNAPKVYYNPEMTLEENCLRTMNYFPDGAIIIPDSQKTLNLWKFDSNIDLTGKSILYVEYMK